MKCRNCGNPLNHNFMDLGSAPLSNGYLSIDQLGEPEAYLPLRVKVCDLCWLVQTEHDLPAGDIFTSSYAYFSSTSTTWLQHAKSFSHAAISKFELDSSSFVIEIAANDGYLLRNFVAAGVPCLGIEPTESTAAAARSAGVPILREFFSEDLGKRLQNQGSAADLIIGNNVFAHIPDLNDFTRGLKAALKTGGAITLEFPHLLQLVQHAQFDTIYHEHYSYLLLRTVCLIFSNQGLRIYDVEELSTHGGSLRVYACHFDDERATNASVGKMLTTEVEFGMMRLETYLEFQSRADEIKNKLREFLLECKSLGKKVAAYGAAAKGNTLLNYADIKPDLVTFVCDKSEAKQGKFMPGSHIPIKHPRHLYEVRPDVLLILPWNIAQEICSENDDLRSAGTIFITAVPELQVV